MLIRITDTRWIEHGQICSVGVDNTDKASVGIVGPHNELLALHKFSSAEEAAQAVTRIANEVNAAMRGY